ncbi:Cysteine desulfurase CsdA, partial [Clarias magur]
EKVELWISLSGFQIISQIRSDQIRVLQLLKKTVLWRDNHTQTISNMPTGHGRPTLTPSCRRLHLLIPHHQGE